MKYLILICSYYDAGRIYRILDGNLFWATQAKNSIEKFPEIDKVVHFTEEIGYLFVGLSESVTKIETNAKRLEVQYEKPDLQKSFPYLDFGSDYCAIFQKKNAGIFNPRLFQKAQITLAMKNGCKIFNEWVEKIEKLDKRVKILSNLGNIFYAKKVIIATGSFTTCYDLVTKNLQSELEFRGNTIVLAQVSKQEAKRLHKMPAVIFSAKKGTEKCYILPPIQYPDEKYYLKIGAFSGTENMNEPILTTPEEIFKWYKSQGSARVVKHLKKSLHSVIPSINVEKFVVDTCVTMHTRSGLPIVRMINENCILCIGGNGQGAKSADSIGKLGAELALFGKDNIEKYYVHSRL